MKSSSENQEENFKKALNQPMPKENIIGVLPSGYVLKEPVLSQKGINEIIKLNEKGIDLIDKPRCKVCGRILKGKNAIKRGMGKTCERKQAEKQTVDIDEHFVWQEFLTEVGVGFSNEAGRELGIPHYSKYIWKYKLVKR